MVQLLRALRMFVTVGVIFTLASAAFADTVRLKDGSRIKGRIAAFSGGRFTIVVGEGSRQRQLTFGAEEVESIEFEGPAVNEQTAQANVRNDPQYIETSAPPRSIPRVVTTDNTKAVNTAPSRTPATQPSVPQVMEPSKIGAKPIEVAVKVLGDNTANGWTNSGWVVKKGQKVRIIGDGKVSLGSGRSTGPSGLYDVDDPSKLLKSVPTGALIAVIGDDNNEFIYVGSERTFVATRDGALFLGVNEGNLEDNSGAFDVRIEIQPS